MKKNGLIALEDGSLFLGESVGCDGLRLGEMVFNTSMTGYQEILTDPSYTGQIICFTFPHIGNVGVNEEDMESKVVGASGIVIRELTSYPSNWRATGDLQSFLKKEGVVAISGIDTRKLTRILREKGNLKACVMGGNTDPKVAWETLKKSRWDVGVKTQIHASHSLKDGDKNVIVMDFGVKHSILTELCARGNLIHCVSSTTSAHSILAQNPDGVLVSNGPGDPAKYKEAISTIQTLLTHSVPLFGICLGHQLLGLASGAKTIKLKHGHHGSNHPISDLSTGKAFISCQNHDFVLDAHTLPSCLKVTHCSLLDGSIAGICHIDKPAFGFQGHPEASPGPHELHFLFNQFCALMETSHV